MLSIGVSARADHSVIEYASGGTTGGNGTQGISSYFPAANGSRVFFETSQALTADDTDSQFDIYEHVVGGGTSLVSTGPQGGNGAFSVTFENTNPDGSHVLFRTDEQLVAADTDTRTDVYDHAGGSTTLVSVGPQSGGCFGGSNAFSSGISPDGSRILFTTNDKLVAEDTDCGEDVYERANGTTTLVSKGSQPQPAGSFAGASPAGISSDLNTVWFTSEIALEPEDTDSSVDIYKRAGGLTTLVSVGPDGGQGAFGASPLTLGPFDGSTYYFQTSEPLVSADTDTSPDIYARDGTATTLVSTGPAGGNGAFTHQFYTATPDGSHALFSTSEALVAADMDTRQDLYEYAAGAVRLVSTGPAGGNGAFDLGAAQIYLSEDGEKVIFMTSEKLVSADQDTRLDSYMRTGGTTTTLISPGTGDFPSTMGAISPNADRVFFHTNERLVGADTDVFMDLYELSGNQVTLISPSPQGGNSSFAPGVTCCPPNVVSRDGSRVFFVSGESYDGADTDNVSDLYVASTSPAPPPPGYPRPKGASPLRVPLVPAYQECTAPNREHGPPLAFGSCNPPAQATSNLTVGTPDANGQAASSIGSVRFTAIAGDPATPVDEADVMVNFSLTDVRVRATLADYTGNLQSTATVRITDRQSGTGTEMATLQDRDFPVTVPCASTAGTVGATCQVTTSFDAVLPGAITEGRRSIWQFDRVRVTEGGQLFATQGIFVP